MNPAASIIAKLGGTRSAADKLGLPPSTVQSWKSVGRIPAQHQVRVLEVASAMKAGVTHADFFPKLTVNPTPQPAAA